MKKVISALILVALFVALGTSNATAAKDKKDVATVEYALSPAPHCQNCVNKIKGNLRFEKGVKDIVVDLEKKSVTITYTPKSTNEEKLASALKKIGYTATPYTGECNENGTSCQQCKDE